MPQGELEHRAPKARYKRTDRHPKRFIKQLAQIERRQARIRRIRARTASHRPREHVASTPHEHHHISVSQNDHEHIGTFLRDNTGDPAIQVCEGLMYNISTMAVTMPRIHRIFYPS
jgi:hypothetical protein